MGPGREGGIEIVLGRLSILAPYVCDLLGGKGKKGVCRLWLRRMCVLATAVSDVEGVDGG